MDGYPTCLTCPYLPSKVQVRLVVILTNRVLYLLTMFFALCFARGISCDLWFSRSNALQSVRFRPLGRFVLDAPGLLIPILSEDRGSEDRPLPRRPNLSYLPS